MAWRRGAVDATKRSMRNRRTGPPSAPVSFDEADVELAETLDSLDDAHNYRRWIFDLLEPYLGPRVLEVGAGHGTFTELLAPGRHVVATDMSPRCAAVLRDRFWGDPAVEVLEADLEAAAVAGPFDAAVMINVLEHIEDDAAALSDLSALLVPAGRLILWVPAFAALYSEFDRRIGHYRRYDIRGLSAKLSDAGFRVDDIRYVNTLGAFAWWVVARQLHRTPTGTTGVQIFDRLFVPVVRRLERGHRPPFGQSIFAVASRDATPSGPPG
jgi:SAM-dependent methyltransferase